MSPVGTRNSSKDCSASGAILLGDNTVVLHGGQIIVEQPRETAEDVNRKESERNQTHLQVLRAEAKEQRELRKYLLRERLKELGDEIKESRENGNDAVSILSEQNWSWILQNVTHSNDIANCARTCTLFEKILRTTQIQWRFAKVFPVLYNVLDQEEILNCRLACKQWMRAIDNFLETYVNAPDDYRLLEEPFTGSGRSPKAQLAYLFHSPRTDDGIDGIREELQQHPKNPFIGRTIALEMDPPEPDSIYDEIKSDIKHFVKDFGHHVRHFKLFGRSQNYPNISPSLYAAVLFRILKKCRKLQTLCLSHVNVPWPLDDSGRQFSISPAFQGKHALTGHSSLETILVYKHNKAFLAVLDNLLEMYSDQLKCVEICLWNNRLYHELSWTNLRRLVVTASDSHLWIHSLGQLEAPNLRELGIRFSGTGQQFRKFMRIINGFDKLEKIELKFAKEFYGFSRNEILKGSSITGGSYSCSETVTNLELFIRSRDNILCYDFLTLFPHLKRLCVRLDAGVGANTFIYCGVRAEQHILQFEKVLSGSIKGKGIYKNYIWEILSRLQFIEIFNGESNSRSSRKVYTRQTHDQRVEKQSN